MKNRKTSLLLLVFILLITIAAGTLAAVFQQQNNRTGAQQKEVLKKVRAEDYPVADYNAQESTDSQESAERRARNRRYDLPDSIKSEDVSRFKLKESDSVISLPLAVSHAKTEAAIPAAESDVVVVGQVIDAQAYLSNDKTSVYSEFTVRVSDVLKNGTAWTLYSGSEIEAERLGGRARFPSGKMLLRGAPYGKNMPRIGQRYLLFLKQNDASQDYSIITGYEMRSGRIFPLDGSPEGDAKSNQFAEYEKYIDRDETTFLNDVRAAIEKAGQSGFMSRKESKSSRADKEESRMISFHCVLSIWCFRNTI